MCDGGMGSGVSPCKLAEKLGPSWSVGGTEMGNVLAGGFVAGRTSGAKSAMVIKGQRGEKTPLPGGEFKPRLWGVGASHLGGPASLHICVSSSY